MHFIINIIHDHVLEVKYCSTDDQFAGIVTKAPIEAKFTKIRFMVGVEEVLTKEGYAPMPPSFSYCFIFVHTSILSQVSLKGGCYETPTHGI